MAARMVVLLIATALSLVTVGCRKLPTTGVLIWRFGEAGEASRMKIELPIRDGQFRLAYELPGGKSTCSLTGQLDDADSVAVDECAASGSGKLVCPNRRTQTFRWTLTSCTGGFGKSSRTGKQAFMFGFGHNQDRALDQLERARYADE